jgi:uncharacterized protein
VRHPAQPYLVSLATLEEGANRVRLEGSADEVGIAPAEAEIEGAIVLEGVLYRAEARVEVQARVLAVALLVCDRCAAPVRQPIDAAVRLLCEKKGERDRRSDAESRAEDSGLLYHDGRTLDLREEVREAVLLEVPWHPLCSPDCRGLCPRCGTNLNERDCGCPPRRGAAPWDALSRMVGEGEPPSPDTSRGKE